MCFYHLEIISHVFFWFDNDHQVAGNQERLLSAILQKQFSTHATIQASPVLPRSKFEAQNPERHWKRTKFWGMMGGLQLALIR